MQRKNPKKGSKGQSSATQVYADRSKQRRAKYAGDPQYRDEAKSASRERYRQGNPLQPPRLAQGLLSAGMKREVKISRTSRAMILDTYTIPEAAAALGRSLANFRRWVNNHLIPEPILKDTTRSYYCYSRGELEIMQTVLTEHERDYAYFCAKHETTSNQIHQRVLGYRNMNYGGDA